MKRTVLILGAGASVPYRYPDGVALIQNIVIQAKKIPEKYSFGRQVHELAEKLQRSGCNSIDAFLSHHPNLKEVGKLLIALELYRAENQAHTDLFGLGRDEDWIRIVFNQLAENIGQVKIITFNYDRLLEKKILDICQARQFTQDSTKKLLDSFEIIHVYGRLPISGFESSTLKLSPHEGSFKKEYGEFFGTEDAHDFGNLAARTNEVIGSIKIIGEASELADQARAHIEWAERVIFLGCSYHRENMKLIGFKSTYGSHDDIYGTVYLMGPIEKIRLTRDFPTLQQRDTKCADLFKTYIDLGQ